MDEADETTHVRRLSDSGTTCTTTLVRMGATLGPPDGLMSATQSPRHSERRMAVAGVAERAPGE